MAVSLGSSAAETSVATNDEKSQRSKPTNPPIQCEDARA